MPGAHLVRGDPDRAPTFIVTDVNVGLLVFLAMSSLGVYAITLGGLVLEQQVRAARRPALRGADDLLRAGAWASRPIGVILLAGSLSLVDIVHAQSAAYAARPAGAAALVRVHASRWRS